MSSKINVLANFNRPFILLILSAVLAGGVAWLAYFYLQQREATLKRELVEKGRKNATPTVQVVVPGVDANANMVLNKSNFVARPVEEDLIYADTILARDFDTLEGQKLARPVMRGRPVRYSDLQAPEVRDVAAVLPDGTRAMTIEIDNINSIAQTLRPSHHIDIFLLSKAASHAAPDGGTDERLLEQASLFMQDMVVLATGRQFQDVSDVNDKTAQMAKPGEIEGGQAHDFDSITLLVKPAEAARLMMGQKLGTFRVVLRGAHDRTTVAMQPLHASDVSEEGAPGRHRGIDFIVGGRGSALVSTLPVGAMAPPFASTGVAPSLKPSAMMQATLAKAQLSASATKPISPVQGGK